MTYRFTGGGEGRFSYQVHGVTAGGVHPAVSMTGENVALCLVNVVWPTPGLPIPSDAFLGPSRIRGIVVWLVGGGVHVRRSPRAA